MLPRELQGLKDVNHIKSAEIISIFKSLNTRIMVKLFKPTQDISASKKISL